MLRAFYPQSRKVWTFPSCNQRGDRQRANGQERTPRELQRQRPFRDRWEQPADARKAWAAGKLRGYLKEGQLPRFSEEKLSGRIWIGA